MSGSRGQPDAFGDVWQAPGEPAGLNSCGSEGECIDFVEFHDFADLLRIYKGGPFFRQI